MGLLVVLGRYKKTDMTQVYYVNFGVLNPTFKKAN